jgi:hypothetical protein
MLWVLPASVVGLLRRLKKPSRNDDHLIKKTKAIRNRMAFCHYKLSKTIYSIQSKHVFD